MAIYPVRIFYSLSNRRPSLLTCGMLSLSFAQFFAYSKSQSLFARMLRNALVRLPLHNSAIRQRLIPERRRHHKTRSCTT